MTLADPLTALGHAGVSIWLDDLSRERLVSGSLADLVANQRVVGVTTNPSIFAKAISSGQAYDSQLRDLAARGVDTGEALRALTTLDVRWACDELRKVYDRTGGQDGRVSIEVDPRLAHDTRRLSRKPGHSGGRSTGPTCSSRSRLPGRGCRPSRPA
jgi:transaldolase